jgi:hypothetical protein
MEGEEQVAVAEGSGWRQPTTLAAAVAHTATKKLKKEEEKKEGRLIYYRVHSSKKSLAVTVPPFNSELIAASKKNAVGNKQPSEQARLLSRL